MGKQEKAVTDFSYKLETKGRACEHIGVVNSDMSGTYRSGIQQCFPHALHAVDKFHAKKLLLDGMDEVRRTEQKAQMSKALNLGSSHVNDSGE